MKVGRKCVNCLPGKLGKCANNLNPKISSASTTFTTSNYSDNTNSSITANHDSKTPLTLPQSSPVLLQPSKAISTPLQPATEHNTISPTAPSKSLTDLWPLSFSWGEHSGKAFYDAINYSYEEVVHWKPNIFLVPFGSAGTSFVKELTRLFQAFADGSSLERICMKAITLIQILLLQKPSKRSKTKDNICHLKRRLDLWSKGDILQLLDEGRCIQTRMLSRLATGKSKIDSHIFRSLMGQGKIKSALSFLSRNQSGGVLGLDEIIPQSQGKTTRDILTEKASSR